MSAQVCFAPNSSVTQAAVTTLPAGVDEESSRKATRESSQGADKTGVIITRKPKLECNSIIFHQCPEKVHKLLHPPGCSNLIK